MFFKTKRTRTRRNGHVVNKEFVGTLQETDATLENVATEVSEDYGLPIVAHLIRVNGDIVGMDVYLTNGQHVVEATTVPLSEMENPN